MLAVRITFIVALFVGAPSTLFAITSPFAPESLIATNSSEPTRTESDVSQRHFRAKQQPFSFELLLLAANDNSPSKQRENKKTDFELGRAFANALIEIRQQSNIVNKNEVIRGISDSLKNANSGISETETQEFISALNKLTSKSSANDRQTTPARGKQYVDDYAKLNAERPGVKITVSGVQYEVLTAGSGSQPTLSDTVLVKYQGSLSNGTVFDTTYDEDKPTSLKMSDVVVPGLKEALQLMHIGDKWRVVIPPKMGFLNFGNNRLRRRDLIYEIELIAIEPSLP